MENVHCEHAIGVELHVDDAEPDVDEVPGKNDCLNCNHQQEELGYHG